MRSRTGRAVADRRRARAGRLAPCRCAAEQRPPCRGQMARREGAARKQPGGRPAMAKEPSLSAPLWRGTAQPCQNSGLARASRTRFVPHASARHACRGGQNAWRQARGHARVAGRANLSASGVSSELGHGSSPRGCLVASATAPASSCRGPGWKDDRISALANRKDRPMYRPLGTRTGSNRQVSALMRRRQRDVGQRHEHAAVETVVAPGFRFRAALGELGRVRHLLRQSRSVDRQRAVSGMRGPRRTPSRSPVWHRCHRAGGTFARKRLAASSHRPSPRTSARWRR